MSARLVYRGSLSLPDSNLVLDGLTFSALVTAQATLLHNPLALALESLRGIPLRFISVVSLADIYFDAKASPPIVLDVHPNAILSHTYFTGLFCLDKDNGLDVGVRVALGDTDATNIVLYASKSADDIIQLSAARIVPAPPLQVLPRPDDPIPRKPPPVLSLKGKDLFPPRPPLNTASSSSSLKRSHSEFKVPADPLPSLERRNKDLIRAIVTKSITLPKNNPDYKETFQMIYRGVMFALRAQMKVKDLSEADIGRLARVHVGMYIDGAKR